MRVRVTSTSEKTALESVGLGVDAVTMMARREVMTMLMLLREENEAWVSRLIEDAERLNVGFQEKGEGRRSTS